MKRKVLQFSMFVILLATVSCSKSDGYSLGAFRISIATVNKISDNSYSLTLDNGKVLYPSASDVRYIPKDNQRVFVNYTILSDQYAEYDHLVKVNDIWNILTKGVIDLTTSNADSIGNDPVKINNIWVANDFMNVGFMFNYSGVRPHAINLVNNTTKTDADGNEFVELEFRHNSYNSQSQYLFEGLACFNLKPFRRSDVDSVNIEVVVKEYDGNTVKENRYKEVYRYNGATVNSIIYETPVLVASENDYY